MIEAIAEGSLVLSVGKNQSYMSYEGVIELQLGLSTKCVPTNLDSDGHQEIH